MLAAPATPTQRKLPSCKGSGSCMPWCECRCQRKPQAVMRRPWRPKPRKVYPAIKVVRCRNCSGRYADTESGRAVHSIIHGHYPERIPCRRPGGRNEDHREGEAP